ncbi:MAG: sugar transferase [Defluviitaleaceae bacterium]|nr:sugar transferase [Defluviitaleaceae bacterium]
MYIYMKRFMDVLCIIAAAPLWVPLLAVLAVLVGTTSSGGVFFTQKRFGQDKKFFQLYKFRSMYTTAPSDMPTHLLKNPQAHITPVGRLLRKFSLDELPQIFNILAGDMSLVGPRPALWNQDDLIAERDKHGANSIPVGLTGLAQIRGRDELPIETKAAYDGEYAKKMSLSFDIKIIFQTAISALTGRGVKEGGAK